MEDNAEIYAQLFSKTLRTQLPSRPINGVSTAATLIDKRQEMEEVDEALRTMKEEFNVKMESIQQRREELVRKQLEMKQSFLKFDKFIKDTEAKRSRALTKQVEEREQAKHLSEEVVRLRGLVGELRKKEAKASKKAESYAVYQDFIDKLVEYASDFREAKDIMSRLDALMSIQLGLSEDHKDGRAVMMKERQVWQDYSAEKTRDILHMTRELAELRQKLEKTRQSVRKYENILDEIQDGFSEKLLEIGKIKMAIFNLFKQVLRVQETEQRVLSRRMDDDIVGQLLDIDELLQDLTFTVVEVKRLVVEERDATPPPMEAESRSRSRLSALALRRTPTVPNTARPM